MKKRILFIENSSSFLVNAIISKMDSAGYECVTVPYDVNRIDAVQTEFEIMFLYIENENTFHDDAVLVYLRDISITEEKKLFLMGDHNDVNTVSGYLDARNVVDTYIRPISAVDVVELMLKALEKVERVGTKKHILVVDDSGTYLHTIKEWLDPIYKVTVVNSATSAITYLAKAKPDLVLLDYEMPICSGPQMLEMIRNDIGLSDTPVMFLTAKGDKESITKVLSLRPQGYLLKTLSKEALIQSIQDFFVRSRIS